MACDIGRFERVGQQMPGRGAQELRPRSDPRSQHQSVPRLSRYPCRPCEGLRGDFTINLISPDNGERFGIGLSNATLTNLQGFQADNADLAISINRTDLEEAVIGSAPLQQQVADGVTTLVGDPASCTHLRVAGPLRTRLEILPGTGGGKSSSVTGPFA